VPVFFLCLLIEIIDGMSTPKKKKAEGFNYDTVSDIDGNNYRTIKVNGGILGANQEWFADNLNVSHFRNGDAIIQSQQFSDWLEACKNGIPAWCYYEENNKLGKIYNLPAILDPRGLAPEGYKIPDYIDFSILGFNAQEYEPIVQNSLGFNVDRNCRSDGSGILIGAQKLMSKEGWKKKGRNTCGLNITGGGLRAGFGVNGFHNFGAICSLWVKPSGWDFKDKESDENFGWIQFNRFRRALPKFKIEDDDFFKIAVKRGKIEITKEDFNIYREWNSNDLLKNNIWFEPNLEAIINYPVNRHKDKSERDFNYAVGCLLGWDNTGSRNGLRTANFSSGKDQIWFTAADHFTGAYVRPFKYS
jgi:uncharacterized protein (TIGR02145 family)